MKILLLGLLSATSLLAVTPHDIRLRQLNAAGSGEVVFTIPYPASGTGMVFYDVATKLPIVGSLGADMKFNAVTGSFTLADATWGTINGKMDTSAANTALANMTTLIGTKMDTTSAQGQIDSLSATVTANHASAFSGVYADLTSKPTLFTGSYADLTGKPTLFSGAYADLSGKPTLFDGQFSSLTGTPSTFAPSAHTQAFSTITATPTTLSGYGITDGVTSASLTSLLAGKETAGAAATAQVYAVQRSNHTGTQSVATITGLAGVATSGAYVDLTGKPTLFSGAYADLTGKPTLFSGAYADLTGKPAIPAAQVQSDWNAVAGLGAVLNKPGIPTNTNQLTNGAGFTTNTGTVTSVAAGAGLTGGTITSTGTIALPNVGTAGTYGLVTTDAQGRVTAGKRQESYVGTTNASGLYTVTYATPYASIPNVQVNTINGNNKETQITTSTTTGFSIYIQLRSDVLGLLPTYSNVTSRMVNVLVTEN